MLVMRRRLPGASTGLNMALKVGLLVAMEGLSLEGVGGGEEHGSVEFNCKCCHL